LRAEIGFDLAGSVVDAQQCSPGEVAHYQAKILLQDYEEINSFMYSSGKG
jgi:hypothetical protein